jgi:hypothetical protein
MSSNSSIASATGIGGSSKLFSREIFTGTTIGAYHNASRKLEKELKKTNENYNTWLRTEGYMSELSWKIGCFFWSSFCLGFSTPEK